MSPEIISILVLVAIFVVATVLPINIGILGFVAAFVVGSTLAGMDGETILEDGFPDELAVTLIGITLLFAMAQNNGTVDWLVRCSVRAVRGRVAAIPWVMFAVAGVLTAFGAVSAAAVAIIAPVALGFAYRYKISPLMMGIMVINGAQAGGFSPTSIYGTITNDAVAKADLPGSPLALFLASLFFNLALAIVTFVMFGGLGLLKRRTYDGDLEDEAPAGGTAAVAGASSNGGVDRGVTSGGVTSGGGAGTGGTATAMHTSTQAETIDDHMTTGTIRPTPYQLFTVAGLLSLGVAILVYELDIGLVAMTVALAVALVSPWSQKKAIQHISWPVVLLIAGMLTYIFVLDEMGTIEYAGKAVAGVGSAMLAALLMCYVGGIVSAFASSTALLPAIIPMAVPFLATGEIGVVGAIAAIAVATTVVDVSPFSTNGAIVLANSAEADQDRVYKQLLVFGAAVVVLAPLAAWAVMVAPGWM